MSSYFISRLNNRKPNLSFMILLFNSIKKKDSIVKRSINKENVVTNLTK